IYNGPGTSEECVTQTSLALSIFNHHIEYIDADKIAEKSWVNNSVLLVMPGGADLPYQQALQGAPNQIIKEYVAGGGSYLGICAGAYYAAREIEFDVGGPLQVIGERELKFYPGTEIGPVLAPYDYNSCSGCRIAPVKWKNDNYTKFDNIELFYNGGGYFKHPEKY